MNKLTVSTFPGNLQIKSPLGISSSHLTGSRAAIRVALDVKPAFLVLKSISERQGGQGYGRRHIRELVSQGLGGTYLVDGPRSLELHRLKKGMGLLRYALQTASADTLIGASVLADEDLTKILPTLQQEGPHFFEINFRYSTLGDKEGLVKWLRTAEEALAVSSIPLLLKISMFAFQLLDQRGMLAEFAKLAQAHRVGLVLFNTRQALHPARRHNGRAALPHVGALVGSALLPDTLWGIARCREIVNLPLIASGGIMNGRDVADALSVGASAVQLCSALMARGIRAFHLCHEELTEELLKRHLDSVSDLVDSKVPDLNLGN